MRMNPALVRLHVSAKLAQKAMESIVTETVARALPLSSRGKAILAGEMSGLQSYVSGALKGIDSLSLLANAMENADLSPEAQIFTRNLYDAVYVTALEAADRVTVENKDTPDMKHIVDNAGFTPVEMKRFMKRSENLNIPELSKIINKKVTAVLKDEMKAYEEERALRDELKDTIRQQKEEVDARLDQSSDQLDGSKNDPTPDMTDDMEDEGLEAVMDLFLSKGDVRHHISLFSKLQDIAMEAALHSSEEFEGIPYHTALRITLENTFPNFSLMGIADDTAIQLEMMGEACEALTEENTPTKVAGTANSMAVLMYTFMETLKTMNLWSPSQQDVKDFIQKPVGVLPNGQMNLPQMVSSRIQDKIGDVMNAVSTMISPSQLQAAYDQCEAVKDKIINLSPQFHAVKESILPKLENAQQKIQQRQRDIREAPVEESVFVSRAKEFNTVSFSRLASVYGHRPDVKEIILKYSPATEDTFIDVTLKGSGTTTVGVDFVSLKRMPELGSMDQIVRNAAAESALAHLNIPVSIYNVDTCTKEGFLNQ